MKPILSQFPTVFQIFSIFQTFRCSFSLNKAGDLFLISFFYSSQCIVFYLVYYSICLRKLFGNTIFQIDILNPHNAFELFVNGYNFFYFGEYVKFLKLLLSTFIYFSCIVLKDVFKTIFKRKKFLISESFI